MSLKSFPKNPDERQMILCLSSDEIDAALKEKNASKILDNQNILIVQTPVSSIAQQRSTTLKNLVEKNLIIDDQLLIIEQGERTSNNYLTFENIVDNFISSNLKRANAYSRFFAALGAKSFHFSHIAKESSDSAISINAKAETPVCKANIEFDRKIKKSLDQITRINKGYEPINCSRDERKSGAQKILIEENLQDDLICSNAFNTFMDGLSKQTSINVELESDEKQEQYLKAVANMDITWLKAMPTTLASLNAKVQLASLTQKIYQFHLKVEF